MRARVVGRVALVLALASTIGCAGRGIRPREYVLSALPRSGAPAAQVAAEPVVSVGPVELPDYLRKAKVVRRSGASELSASDAEVWSEDLAAGFTRVLGENLSLLIPTNRVVTFPAHESLEPDYRVIVIVERFEVGDDGAARLDARWRVAEVRSTGTTLVRRSSVAEPATGPDTLAAVDAMSRALAVLSREIADAIRASAATR